MIRIKYKRWFIQFKKCERLPDRFIAWASAKPTLSPLDLCEGDVYFWIDKENPVSKLKAELDELDAQVAA